MEPSSLVARGLGRAITPPSTAQGTHAAVAGLLAPLPKDTQEVQLRELRYHLAIIKQKEALAADANRQECEALLEGAVELRAERRYLQQESQDCRQYLSLYTDECNMQWRRWDNKNLQLHEELSNQRAHLDEARAGLQELNSEWVLEDEPEEAMRRLERRAQEMREEQREWADATIASEELSEKLRSKVGGLEEEIYTSRGLLKAGKSRGGPKTMVTAAEFKKLSEETRMLAAKVALESQDVQEEVSRLWIHGENEIPRLRAAQLERQRLQRMLMDTRWEHDNLQRDYDRVLSGLRDQEKEQEMKCEELVSAMEKVRQEGEDMMQTVRENDAQISEMRHDRMETELFVQHLNGHIARLEDERDSLQEIVKQAAAAARRPGADPTMRALGPDGHEEVLAWLKEDRERLLEEFRDAMHRDEAEANAVQAECEDCEDELMQVEERNAMLRSEVSMAEPLLLQGGRPPPGSPQPPASSQSSPQTSRGKRLFGRR